MKRLLITALAAAAVLCLCACGAADEPERVPVTPVQPHEAAEPASGSEAAPPAEAPASGTDIAEPPAAEEPAAEEEDASAREMQARFEQAEALIGHPAQELFDILGEPESSQYASSCEVDGGEDGMLFYDGFYVWTLRTAEEETVRAVYLDE